MASLMKVGSLAGLPQKPYQVVIAPRSVRGLTTPLAGNAGSGYPMAMPQARTRSSGIRRYYRIPSW